MVIYTHVAETNNDLFLNLTNYNWKLKTFKKKLFHMGNAISTWVQTVLPLTESPVWQTCIGVIYPPYTESVNSIVTIIFLNYAYCKSPSVI